MKIMPRILACWFVFVCGLVASGIAMRVLHLSPIEVPGGPRPGLMFLLSLIAGLVLVIGLWPIARGLSGSYAYRAVALAAFLLLAFGVNTLIETAQFTTLLDGHIASAALFYCVVSLFLGLTMSALFGSAEPMPRGRRGDIPLLILRLLAAWISFPVIYLIFGMCIAPIVVPYYSGISYLRIPPMLTIIEIQMIRSVIFLACTLPLIALWKGTRKHLWIALGLAHAVVVGLYGLTSAIFLPRILRVTHGVEIVADSFVYAGVLVALFLTDGGKRVEQPEPEKAIHA